MNFGKKAEPMQTLIILMKHRSYVKNLNPEFMFFT